MALISLQYTLCSIVSRIFISTVENHTFIHQNDSPNTIIKKIEEAGVWSIMLRGSCIFLHTYSNIEYPKNVADIDCNVLGSGMYNKEAAQQSVSEFFQFIFHSLGWSLLPDERPIIHHKDHATHKILIEKKYLLDKSRWFIQGTISSEELQQIISQKKYFQLSKRDVLMLEDTIQSGKSVDFSVPINCIFRFYSTDLKVYNIHGKEIKEATKFFYGMSCYSPLSQLVEKIACINVPYRNKAIDILDAYNLIVFLKKQTKQYEHKQLQENVRQSMYQDKSRFKKESIINALHAIDIDLAMYILQTGTVPETFSLEYNMEQEEIWFQQLRDDFTDNYLKDLPKREVWSDICQTVRFWSITLLRSSDCEAI